MLSMTHRNFHANRKIVEILIILCSEEKDLCIDGSSESMFGFNFHLPEDGF